MNPTKKTVSVTAMRIAQALAERGARTSVIEVLTGMTKGVARSVIRDATGLDPRSGLLPVCSATLIFNRRRHAQASIAASLLELFQAYNENGISADSLIAAYDTYLMLNSGHQSSRKPISITELFVIARDLRTDSAELRRCNVCWSKWLYCHETHKYCECPHCRLLTEATCPQCQGLKSTRARLCHSCNELATGRRPKQTNLSAPMLQVHSA